MSRNLSSICQEGLEEFVQVFPNDTLKSNSFHSSGQARSYWSEPSASGCLLMLLSAGTTGLRGSVLHHFEKLLNHQARAASTNLLPLGPWAQSCHVIVSTSSPLPASASPIQYYLMPAPLVPLNHFMWSLCC